MLPIPATTLIGDAETDCTFDADRVLVYINGGAGLTGLLFDNGHQMTVNIDYHQLMEELAAVEDTPPPRAKSRK